MNVTPVTPASDAAVATFSQRALGRAIDFVMLFVLVTGALGGFAEKQADGSTHIDAPVWFLALLAAGVVAWEVVPVRLRGQTPGKMLTHTRVVRASDGSVPGWRAAFIRWGIVVAVLLAIGPFSAPASLAAVAALYASALLDPNGRSLLDRAAGTRVVQVPGRPRR